MSRPLRIEYPGAWYHVMKRIVLIRVKGRLDPIRPFFVDIKGYGLGPYNRILGVLYVTGNNVNIELIKAGLAEVYRGKPPRDFDLKPYSQAESEAKNAKRGIWSLGVKYISPKDWRKRNKR